MRVSTIHVRALAAAFEQRGFAPSALFTETRLSEGLLANDYSWVEVEALDALTCAAVRLSGDPAFGLHWGERASLLQFDLASLLVAAAPSLRTGLERLSELQVILSDKPELAFSEQDDHALLRFEPMTASAESARVRTELMAAGFSYLLHELGASEDQIARVSLAYAEPSYGAEYARLFHGSARFEQPFSGLYFARELLDMPLGVPNPALYRALDRQANELSARILGEASLRDRIGQQLRVAFPHVQPMREAASSLGLSERSLRRRLAEHGATYSQLVEEVRFEVAQKLLDEPARSLKEVAAAVGFAEIGAFHRAFKRWTGKTPSEFRAARRAAAH